MAAHVFMQTLDAVDGGVCEDERVLGVKEDVKDVEHGGDVSLARFVHLLARRVLDADGAQRGEERTPAGANLRRARLHQLAQRRHDLQQRTHDLKQRTHDLKQPINDLHF